MFSEMDKRQRVNFLTQKQNDLIKKQNEEADILAEIEVWKQLKNRDLTKRLKK